MKTRNMKILLDMMLITVSVIAFYFIINEKTQESRSLESSIRTGMSLEAASAGSWYYDVEKDELLWDKHMFKLFEIKRKDWKPNLEGFIGRLHPNDKESIKSIMADSIKNKAGFHANYRIITGDKTIKKIIAFGHVSLDGKEFAGICLPDVGAGEPLQQF